MSVRDIKPAKTKKRGGKKQRGPGYKFKPISADQARPRVVAAEIRKGVCRNCGYTISPDAAKILRESGAPAELNCPNCSGIIPF
jgi:hypothetical protein